jgi:hypothetical protein
VPTNPIPLFTSIPPRFKRQSPEGHDVGREYGRRCIDSWRASGFAPVSVNSADESEGDLVSLSQIDQVRVGRDARSDYGKPVTYLADFFAAICEHTRGPIAITNADILLQLQARDHALLASLTPGQCLVAKRFDFDSLGAGQAREYPDGYDFFACHSDDLRGLSPISLAIGMPWWDHYLPLVMALNGVRAVPVHTPFAFHLAHEDRWDHAQWLHIGNRFLAEIVKPGVVVRTGTTAVQSYMATVQARQRAERRALSDLRAQRRRTSGHVEPTAAILELENQKHALAALANVNVHWIDHWRRTGSGLRTR